MQNYYIAISGSEQPKFHEENLVTSKRFLLTLFIELLKKNLFKHSNTDVISSIITFNSRNKMSSHKRDIQILLEHAIKTKNRDKEGGSREIWK